MNLKLILSALTLFGSVAMADKLCPNNDFKACDKVLKSEIQKGNGKDFIQTFDDICSANSKFRCTKATVLGDLNERMKELREERKGASLFEVKQDDGAYIYVFEKRAGKK